VSEQEAEGRSVQSPEQRRDALAERIFGSCIGFMEILSSYVGDRLGFYRALVGLIKMRHFLGQSCSFRTHDLSRATHLVPR
jgi:hypothetical protein